MGQLIPLQAAAKKYGLDRSTLHRWLQAGKLTKHRAAAGDRRTYLDLAELKQLLEVKLVPHGTGHRGSKSLTSGRG